MYFIFFKSKPIQMHKCIKLILILALIVLASCNSDNADCGECNTPPNTFVFNLLDKTTGLNVFESGKYETQDIEITNIITDTKIVDFDIVNPDSIGITFIQINSIGWETEKVNYLIKIVDTEVCNLVVDAERKSEDCCSFTQYNEISIENTEYEFDLYSGYYTVYID